MRDARAVAKALGPAIKEAVRAKGLPPVWLEVLKGVEWSPSGNGTSRDELLLIYAERKLPPGAGSKSGRFFARMDDLADEVLQRLGLAPRYVFRYESKASSDGRVPVARIR